MQLLSAIRTNRTLQAWTGITLFCFLFSMIYEFFSFGVISWYMCLLALIPLFLGVMPVLAAEDMGRYWNDGVLCLIAGSALQGILEIYGTDSPYPKWFLIIGVMLLGIGLAAKIRASLNQYAG